MASERIGEYRIVGEISRTAAAMTYEAVHAVLPRRAVLKVMASPTQRIAIRALREAIYLETMDHPGIPRLYESGLLADRRAWFARELVDGPSLSSLFARKRIDPMDILERVRDIAEVLAHAHSHGVVHGSLRPDRIILARRPRGFVLCIADWSDARAHDAAATPFVASPGAWHYAAPEAVVGDAIDDRADVFSLGVIAYKLLTGTLPFERGALHTRNMGGEHVPTNIAALDAPRELCAIVDQMLAFDRWDRPSSTEVFKDTSWLVEALASARLRIRNPRWTPQIEIPHPVTFQAASLEPVDIVRMETLRTTALEAALLELADAEVDDEYAEVEISGPIERPTDSD